MAGKNGTWYLTLKQNCDVGYFNAVEPNDKSGFSPDPKQFKPKESSTGFSCSMDGYTKMTIEITELLLVVISMYKEIWAAILPENLALSLKYAYQGLTGVSGWIGYAIAALYYMAEDQGFGDTLCEISGYGDVVVEALYKMVDFGTTTSTN
jgi:hypothetical protein